MQARFAPPAVTQAIIKPEFPIFTRELALNPAAAVVALIACSASAQAGILFSDATFDMANYGSTTSTQFGVSAGTKLDYSQLYTNGTISITAVPEPGSLTLMLAGLLGVGAVARRRRAVPAAA